ncbi:MAG TPA: hypothetical protein VH541_00710 [Gaiellaceae bacterium]|jgi:hypothetical protein
MYRHDLRLVLRFGVHGEFAELARRLHEEEYARGWTPPRIWQAVNGPVNQIVLEHDYADDATYRIEREAFHADPGGVGDVLAELARLAVPGTAAQYELAGVSAPPA